MTKYFLAVAILTTGCNAFAEDWVKYEECPVLLENLVYVPALESGVVGTVAIEQNAEVTENQTLGTLDDHDVRQLLSTAKLTYQHALNLAKDDSGIRLSKSILAERQERLNNSLDIKDSIGKYEISQQRIQVEQAQAGVSQAEHALSRAMVDAHIKYDQCKALEAKLKRHTITAPCTGIVTKIEAKRGQYIELGKPILTIAVMDTINVDLLIDEKTATRMVGKRARVLIDGVYLDGEITSHNIDISTMKDVRVHAKMQNKRDANGQWLLRPGKEVNLEVAN